MPVSMDFLFLAFFAWPGLQIALYQRLKTFHITEFQRLGSPRLFFACTPGTNWLLFKFLIQRKYKLMNDPVLGRLGGSMLIFLIVYIVSFISVVIDQLT
jgi:hypothetical protein